MLRKIIRQISRKRWHGNRRKNDWASLNISLVYVAMLEAKGAVNLNQLEYATRFNFPRG
jgi:hypothetical protein